MNISPSAPRRVEPKVGKNALGCALGAVVTFLIIVCLLVFAIAKTGVLHVPVFSNLYHGPVPTRLVPAQPITPAAFKVLLGSRFISQAVAHVPPPYTIQLSEKELTGAVMDAIDTALRDQSWKQVYSQIVVRSTDLELYGQFERAPLHVDMLVRFHPVVTNGGVRFDPFFVQIGDYQLPASFAYRLASYIFSRDLGTWTIGFGDEKLQSVIVRNGALDLVAQGK